MNAKTRCTTLLLCLLALFSIPIAARPGREDEELPPARQNLILREFFRPVPSPEWADPATPVLPQLDRRQEDYIDRQIDHFVQELEGRLEQIEKDLQDAKAAAQAMDGDNGLQSASRQRWAESLQALSRHLRGLHRYLARIPLGLDKKAPRPVPWDAAHPARALSSVEHHFREAQARIVGFFLQPSHVIRLADLEDGTMLTHLDEAVRIAQGLHRQLKD